MTSPGPARSRGRRASNAGPAGKGSVRRPVRVMRSRTPVQRRRLAFLLVASSLVGLLVFGVVSLQALVSQTSFRMQELNRESSSLQASFGQLKLEVARLSAPERIAEEAHRLGLVVPDRVHTITVRTATSASDGRDQPNDGVAFALKRLAQEDP